MYRLAISIALVLMAALANYGFSRPEPALDRRPFKEFPRKIGEWVAVDERHIGKGSMAVLKVDDYIMRTYINKKGETIGLYIGYFKTQKEGKQIHSPRQCLPGAGWSTVEYQEYMLPLKGHNPPRVPINLYLMGKGKEKQLYLWWYQGRGRIYADEFLNKFYIILDSILKRRTDGALVRVNMPVTNSIRQVLATQVNFINLIFPKLKEFIPE